MPVATGHSANAAAGPAATAAPEVSGTRLLRNHNNPPTLRHMPTRRSLKKPASKLGTSSSVSSSTAESTSTDGLPPSANDRVRRAYTTPAPIDGHRREPSAVAVPSGLANKLSAFERFRRVGRTKRSSEWPSEREIEREQWKGKERERRHQPSEGNMEILTGRSLLRNKSSNPRRTTENAAVRKIEGPLRVDKPLPAAYNTVSEGITDVQTTEPHRVAENAMAKQAEEVQVNEPAVSAPESAPAATKEEAQNSKANADTGTKSVEKPEALATYLTRRMQSLMSGLSFPSVTAPATPAQTSPAISAKASVTDALLTPAQVPVVTVTREPVTAQEPRIRGPDSRQEPVITPVERQKQVVQSNARLAALLASTREMNNSLAQGAESAWAALDRLKQPLMSQREKDSGKGKAEETESATASTVASTSGSAHLSQAPGTSGASKELEGSRDIMLYSPLIPDNDSLVEMATSEVVTLYDDDGERAYRAELRRRWAEGRGFVSLDSLPSFVRVEGGKSGEQAEEGYRGKPEKPEEKHEEKREKIEDKVERPKPKEKVVWVPSKTDLSIQVLWWGYRMYLPPPVLEILNNKSLEAAKRAALITTALTWLFDHLPMTILPMHLQPAAAVLKCLAPLLGAIGTFISWSWRAIGTFDKGQGVVLSATWLLPVVLIPGTWEDGEMPDLSPNQAPSSAPGGECQNVVVAGPSRSRLA
ncbi:hypothetical protein M0805_005849 [Coniferiporia weirii]|nr:hypothetical protein M0805_005849 [Coniferiporia weirii]